MITNFLEEKIHKGKAKYKTYAMGGSAVGTIPCPEGQYLVVTDFIWWGFNDVSPIVDPVAAANKTIHTMRLLAGYNKMLYNFRDAYALSSNANGIAPVATLIESYPGSGSGVQTHTYFVAEEEVQIDIWNFDSIVTWQAGAGLTEYSAVLPSPSNEPAARAGYAGKNAIRRVVTQSGASIISLGLEREDQAFIRATNFPRLIREEFFDSIIAGVGATILSDPVPTNSNFAFPLVTFGYVLINEKPSEKLM